MIKNDKQNNKFGISSNQRQIRVFVSSTFKDMHAERELLVKQVFPELRRICAERFATFTEVDLRWGITEEQAAEGKVLPICLEEINRCRPYFIGLLGERYGWIPESLPKEVIENESWLKEHVGGRTSVTELEILHGVLNNPDMAGHAFFYFRDPAYTESIPVNDRNDFISENPESARKLQALKERIRQSGLPVKENYSDPKELAATVREQFITLIDQFYPKEDVPDSLDQETMGHEAYGRGKLLGYVERPSHTEAIDSFVNTDSTGQGLVITGESGSGKSALLAAWVHHWQKSHPKDYMFQHYFGATPESTSVTAFLKRLMGELKRRYDITDEIPYERDKLREALPYWLAQASAKIATPDDPGKGMARLVLILDALDQIEGDEPDRSLSWLPNHFPNNVKVIASAIDGLALETIRECGWSEHPLPLADKQERSLMIQAFLDHFRKKLPKELSRQLVEEPGCSNPLFLRTVLEELRQFGSFEQLPKQIYHYLQSKSHVELLRRVICRWQEDFDAGQDLVKCALRHLWAARQGLSENELMDLLGTEEKTLPRQVWSPLFLAMEPHLIQSNRLYTFGHDFLRLAVQAKFLTSEENRKNAHLTLADYFENQYDMTLRKASEWPWQLHAAESWERLKGCLTNIKFFVAMNSENYKLELSGYWRSLQEKGESIGLCYLQTFQNLVQIDPAMSSDYLLMNEIGNFLIENNYYTEADFFHSKAYEGRKGELGMDHPATVNSEYNLGAMHWAKGDYITAEQLLRQALTSAIKNDGEEDSHTLNYMNGLALTLKSKGEYEEAETLYRQALKNCKISLGDAAPLTLLISHNLADLLYELGSLSEAEELWRRTIKLKKRILGKDHPDTLSSINGLSVLINYKGDYDQAEKLKRSTLESSERVLGKDDPVTLTYTKNLADTLDDKGEYAEAECLYRHTLEGRERVLGKEHPDTLTIVNDLAVLLYSHGDYDKAEPIFRKALLRIVNISNELGKEHSNLKTFKENYSNCLQAMGHTEIEIIDKLSKLMELSETVPIENMPDTIETNPEQFENNSVEDQGIEYYNAGKYADALRLFEQQVAHFRQEGDMDKLQQALNYVGYALKGLGDLDKAMATHKEQEAISRDNNLPFGIALSLTNQAEILANDQGNPEAAMPLAHEALKIFHRIGKTHLAELVKEFIKKYDPDFTFEASESNATKNSRNVVNLASYRKQNETP